MSQVTIYSDLNFGGLETRSEIPILQQLTMIVQYLTQLPSGKTVMNWIISTVLSFFIQVTSDEIATGSKTQLLDTFWFDFFLELGIDDLEFNPELEQMVLDHGSIIVTTKKDLDNEDVYHYSIHKKFDIR